MPAAASTRPPPDLGRIPPPDSTRPHAFRVYLSGALVYLSFFSAKAVGRLRRIRPPDLGCTSPPDSTRPHAFRVYLSGALGYLSLFWGLFIICLLQDPGKILQDPVIAPLPGRLRPVPMTFAQTQTQTLSLSRKGGLVVPVMTFAQSFVSNC